MLDPKLKELQAGLPPGWEVAQLSICYHRVIDRLDFGGLGRGACSQAGRFMFISKEKSVFVSEDDEPWGHGGLAFLEVIWENRLACRKSF